jgi:membrane protease YdiL (CAAX protease family)
LLGAALLLNSATQEVLVRGYLLQTIESRFGTLAAVIGSSLLFVLLHAGALVEGGWLPAANLFGAGVLLGLAFTTTRNLWLPIALHFSWNFLQGPVLGISVSGHALGGGWRLIELEGPPIFTGGPFGLEGGLAATAVTAVGIAVLLAAGRWRGERITRGENDGS